MKPPPNLPPLGEEYPEYTMYNAEYATYNSVYATEKFVRDTYRLVHATHQIVRGVYSEKHYSRVTHYGIQS